MRSIWKWAACAAVAAISVSANAGTCDGWRAGPMTNQSIIGTNGVVLASAIYTPPNGSQLLVIGGSFTQAGGVPVNNIAAWDGASWRALGTGTNGSVFALSVFNNELYAGGTFTAVNGSAASRIARWNGTTWNTLSTGLVGSLNVSCKAMQIFNGELYVGGKFGQAGAVSVNNIAKWNGSAWSTLNGSASGVFSPNPVDDEVRALRVHNSLLYIGGLFSTANFTTVNNIVAFNGASFSTLLAGTNNYVNALNEFNGDLVVGGSFSQVNGALAATHVARWTAANTWATLGGGIGGSAVYAFQPFNGQLVAGCDISGGVLSYNGSSWSVLGGGTQGGSATVFTLTVNIQQLVAGGSFVSVGPSQNQANNIAQWDTASWQGLYPEYPQVFAYETMAGRIFAGGLFNQTTGNTLAANNILSWNGATMFPLTSGTNGGVRALHTYATGIGVNITNHMMVAGDFTVAGGMTANRIALWNEGAFTIPTWSTLGSGFNTTVEAVERFNNVLYAAGDFTASGATPVNFIAQFNGTNWVAVGTGMNGVVHALKVFNGFLYAGGDFTTAGGVSTGGLARWNGTAWSNVGGFFNGSVYALEVHNNELIIGGSYPGLNGWPNIARYNGTNYINLAAGNTNGPILALKSDGTNLYMAGPFSVAGGVNANRVARWSIFSGFLPLGGGTNDSPAALGSFHNELQVGYQLVIGLAGGDGGGDSGGDGGIAGLSSSPSPGNGWTRYSLLGQPWIAQQPPFSVTSHCGQPVTIGIKAAINFNGVTYQWRKGTTPLANGATGHGSTYSGVNTDTLTITNAERHDQGQYNCVMSSPCGGETSSSTTLAITICATCPGDVDGNDVVNVDDLLAVVNSWGNCPACPADVAPFGGNGVVNVDDLLAVINGWGACP